MRLSCIYIKVQFFALHCLHILLLAMQCLKSVRLIKDPSNFNYKVKSFPLSWYDLCNRNMN